MFELIRFKLFSQESFYQHKIGIAEFLTLR